MAWQQPVYAGLAKYGPQVGAHLTKYFPRYLGGALMTKGALEEGPWGAVKGAVGGYGFGQLGNRALIGGISEKVLPRIAGQAIPGSMGQLTAGLAQAGIPLGVLGGNVLLSGVGGAVADTAGRAAQQAGNFGTSAGVGWVAHNTVTGESIPMGPAAVQAALAPGMGQYGPTGPMGTILDQVSPTSPYAGRRLGTKLDARANAEALNILMPTMMKYAEETKRRDLARNLQAAGVRTNIASNAELNRIAAAQAANIGQNAASQLGGAITQNYSFG